MTKAIVTRSIVGLTNNYRDYRDTLRYDFWYSCAYCSITELEASAIGFEIDHYYPQKNHPNFIHDYNNLMWACEKCNGYKSNFDPDKDDIEKGNIVLRPDFDDPREHLKLEGYFLKNITHTGEFNIERLDLNRLQLRRLREIRERFWNASEYLAFGIHELLKFRIDKLNPKQRFPFLKLKNKVQERYNQRSDSLNSLIRKFAKSDFLDDDPNKKERNRKRKEYLREQKAIPITKSKKSDKRKM